MKLIGNSILRHILKLFAGSICLILLLLTFPSCTAQKPATSHIKVGVLPYMVSAGFYVPFEYGYFAQQGIEVEFVKFLSSVQAIPLVAQGSLDVAGIALSASFFNATAQEANMKIVAGGERVRSDCESLSLMVRKDLYYIGEVNALAKIKGKKVAIPAIGALDQYVLGKILETAKLGFNDIEIAKIGPDETMAALEKKSIDAAMIGAPRIEKVKALNYAVTLESTNKIMPGFQQNFIIFGQNLMEKSPDIANKFMVAFIKGARTQLEGKTKKNIEILQKYTGLDENTLRGTCWNPVDPDGKIETKDITAFQEWLEKNNFLDKKINDGLLVENKFVDYAVKNLGAAQKK